MARHLLKLSLGIAIAVLALLPLTASASEVACWRCDDGPVTSWCKGAGSGLDGKTECDDHGGSHCELSGDQCRG
jgi:hypothetical protein